MTRKHPKYCKHNIVELDEIVDEPYCTECGECLEDYCPKCLQPKTELCEEGECDV